MPELPEVETTRRFLIGEGVVGRRVQKISVPWLPTVYDDTSIREALCIRRICDLDRMGKILCLTLDSATLVTFHLRMSGRLYLTDVYSHEKSYVRFAALLDDNRWLCLHDPRKFARIAFGNRARHQIARLGVDALSPDFSPHRLAQIADSTRRSIKALLLDQNSVAGLGNIYTDESLWLARVHPLRTAVGLNADEITAIHSAVRETLRKGIRNGGTALGSGASNFRVEGLSPPRNQLSLNVFQRTLAPCPRCGTAIEKIRVAQRGTHVCPKCQQL